MTRPESVVHAIQAAARYFNDGVGSNAILDRTDAVMLSAETATGQYPVEAVRMMTAITQSVEASDILKTLMHKNVLTQEDLLANACLAGESLVSIPAPLHLSD